MPKRTTRVGHRARQVLEALYRLGEASAQDVVEAVPDLPSYSAARSVLQQLHEKGLVRRREHEFKYLYAPAVPRERASRSALAHVLHTFFDGSPEKTMEALLDLSRSSQYDVDLDRLEELLRRAREEGR